MTTLYLSIMTFISVLDNGSFRHIYIIYIYILYNLLYNSSESKASQNISSIFWKKIHQPALVNARPNRHDGPVNSVIVPHRIGVQRQFQSIKANVRLKNLQN